MVSLIWKYPFCFRLVQGTYEIDEPKWVFEVRKWLAWYSEYSNHSVSQFGPFQHFTITKSDKDIKLRVLSISAVLDSPTAELKTHFWRVSDKGTPKLFLLIMFYDEPSGDYLAKTESFQSKSRKTQMEQWNKVHQEFYFAAPHSCLRLCEITDCQESFRR